jgi:histidyl-tRNA synthetase
LKYQAPRGTYDIFPQDAAKWQHLEEIISQICDSYNYEEIRVPLFEETALFKRGIGENTDVVEKEMYTFDDKRGRSLTLRPEATASVMRAFLENKVYGEAQPTKYYYVGPMFRYEKPQSGRQRQFHQFGIEALGADDPALDAEVIDLGIQLVKKLGLKDLEVQLNSVGCEECRPGYITKLKDYVEPYLEDLCSDCQSRYERNPLRILDCKEDNEQDFMEDVPKLYEELCEECSDHFEGVKEYLELLDVDYVLDPTLVRGLDYYTNTAFEVVYEGLGAQDTIFGGGRYNGLAEEIGDRDVPAVGFALGLERLLLTLQEQGIDLPLERDLDLFITTIGDKAQKKAASYLQKLRAAGLKVEMDYLNRSVKGQMKHADRNNAQYSIILGENELEAGTATIRNMKTGEQREVKLNKLVEEMKDCVE